MRWLRNPINPVLDLNKFCDTFSGITSNPFLDINFNESICILCNSTHWLWFMTYPRFYSAIHKKRSCYNSVHDQRPYPTPSTIHIQPPFNCPTSNMSEGRQCKIWNLIFQTMPNSVRLEITSFNSAKFLSSLHASKSDRKFSRKKTFFLSRS